MGEYFFVHATNFRQWKAEPKYHSLSRSAIFVCTLKNFALLCWLKHYHHKRRYSTREASPDFRASGVLKRFRVRRRPVFSKTCLSIFLTSSCSILLSDHLLLLWCCCASCFAKAECHPTALTPVQRDVLRYDSWSLSLHNLTTRWKLTYSFRCLRIHYNSFKCREKE